MIWLLKRRVRQMNKMTLKQIFWLFAVGFLTYFVIRYMWPLLLVIFGIMVYG